MWKAQSVRDGAHSQAPAFTSGLAPHRRGLANIEWQNGASGHGLARSRTSGAPVTTTIIITGVSIRCATWGVFVTFTNPGLFAEKNLVCNGHSGPHYTETTPQ